MSETGTPQEQRAPQALLDTKPPSPLWSAETRRMSEIETPQEVPATQLLALHSTRELQ